MWKGLQFETLSTASSVKYSGDAYVCGTLAFNEDLIADRSNTVNGEIERVLRFSQFCQKDTGHFNDQQDNDKTGK